MAIETVLYGKRAIVSNEKELQLRLRKQELVLAAAAMGDQPDESVFSEIVEKIIRINRKLASIGNSVQFLD